LVLISFNYFSFPHPYRTADSTITEMKRKTTDTCNAVFITLLSITLLFPAGYSSQQNMESGSYSLTEKDIEVSPDAARKYQEKQQGSKEFKLLEASFLPFSKRTPKKKIN